METFAADACGDDCSVCLESFTAQNPATVTTCKHEYHLQCILEWSQRSGECPICWRSLTLSDPVSQELLAGVEVQRNSRTRRIVHHEPTFYHTEDENFRFHNVHPESDDSDNDEHIMQELAAVMGRTCYFGRREGHMSSHLDRTRLMAFGTPSSAFDMQQTSSSGNQSSGHLAPPEVECPRSFMLSPTTSHFSMEWNTVNNRQIHLDSRTLMIQTPPGTPENMQQSESPSFSDSLRSKFSAASSRYKETITRSTRNLKDKLFTRNNSMKELGKEVKREVTAGIVGVARMMERLELTPKKTGNVTPVSNCSEGTSEMLHDCKNLRKIQVSVPPDESIASIEPVTSLSMAEHAVDTSDRHQ